MADVDDEGDRLLGEPGAPARRGVGWCASSRARLLTVLVCVAVSAMLALAARAAVGAGGAPRAFRRPRTAPRAVARASALPMAIAANVFLSEPSAPLGHELCGLVKWCADASQFASRMPALAAAAHAAAAAPRSVPAPAAAAPPWAIDVVLSTNAPATALRAECPQPNVRIESVSAELVSAVANFTTRSFDRREARRRYRWKHGGKDAGYKLGGPERVAVDAAWLAKWAMVGLTRYALILVLDLDIDLALNAQRGAAGPDAQLARAAAVWADELPRFVASGARLLSSLDGSAFINMGSVWLRPSAELYAEGVRLLRTNRFSIERGFADAGPPSELLPAALLHTPSPVFGESRTMAQSDALLSDSWNFVAASADQGLFPLIFAMRHHLLALVRRPEYSVHHYLGRFKPWRQNHPSCPAYFVALGILAPVDATAVDGTTPSGAPASRAPAGVAAAAAAAWRLAVAPNAPPPPGRAASVCWPRLVQAAAALVALTDAARGDAASVFARECHARQQVLF
ncbi:hypothetical protein KFE25_011375 [Diacronema lutheri]|uniref:Uncharacterized protein n=2 Tax=Diacronema lutheri TaxID=2081491 RepID=A0A8J5XKR6_DIALT|nr:hypothetical protein KFE25_011375 [Diacronema lutheri]